jgi:hypothetical protein
MNKTETSQVQHQKPGSACCQASHEEVARAAFTLYEKSGSESGHCERNWLAAEADVAATHAATAHGPLAAGRPAASAAR